MNFLNIPKALNNKKGEIRTIIVLIGMAVIGLGILIGSQVRDGRINLLPRASEADTYKIMSLNVLEEPLCRGVAKHTEEMKSIMDYARNNKISLLALQEVVKLDQKQDNCPDFDLSQYIQDNASGYSVDKSEYIRIHREADKDEDDIDKWWYRLLVHDTPMVGQLERIQIDKPHSGFDVMVTNTKLGPIRFIHLHNHHHQIMDSLIPLVKQYKAQDSIPIIVLGDFNIRYTGDNGYIDEFNRMKHLEENAGLYRACDPAKFPNGGCTDTINGSGSADDEPSANDHILIDDRAKFIVKNAYVDKTSLKFSNHFPVIVELQGGPAGTGSADDPTTQQPNDPLPTLPPAAPIPQNINIWNQVKPAAGNIYPWSNGGPTTGWESFISNWAYICNGKYCWVFNRNTLAFNNNGQPFAMDTDPGYSTLKAAPNGTLPWSNGGPTAAWTWILNQNGQTVNENLLCNGNYCWRYLRTPTAAGSGWRDGGNPIHLPTLNDFWKDPRISALWSGNGVTVAWTDPINSNVTLCNKNDCRSIDYKNWQWRFNGDKIQPYPPGSGVTEYNAAWTSPATFIITQCVKNSCWKYDIPKVQYSTSAETLISTPPAPTPPTANIWDGIKPAPGNILLWTNGGPTAGWESFISGYVYMCNGKYCWVYSRNEQKWNNDGNPIALDTDPGYSTLKAATNGTLPWSNGGPTAAWTWILTMDGQKVNENMLCNGNYCWRYLRYPTGTKSGWRDGGSPIHLPTYGDFWKDARVAPLWTGNGVTVAWTDPINNRVTLCNKNDCRSLDYGIWQWRFNGQKIQPYPPGSGVTEYNSAWTSPVTKIIAQCVKNNCWHYDIPNAKYSTSAEAIFSNKVPTSAPTQATNAKPVLNTFTWNPQIPVKGSTVTGTITGTDVDSQTVNVEVHVFSTNYPDVIFSKGNTTVTAGKWTYKATQPVPNIAGTKFTAYVIINDGVNSVRSSNYDVIATTAPTASNIPTKTPIPSCTNESDGGNKPDVGGSLVSKGTDILRDTCTGSSLKEYYCSATGATSATYTCQYGCGNGRCLSQPPTSTPIPNMGVVTLTSPIGSAILKPGNVTLQWTVGTGATSYEWIINRTGKFKSGTVTGTSVVVPSLPPGNYTWQVISKGTSGARASALAQFKIPFSKLKPLANSQITYGSTQSFEWTPMLPYDITNFYVLIAEAAAPNSPFYYKQLTKESVEYQTGKLSVPLNSTTNAKFVLGKTYVWQIVLSIAGNAQEHYPPFDSTSTPQSFTLAVATPTPTLTKVPTVINTIPPIATSTKVPTQPIFCARKSQGDANCDGIVNLIDIVCWLEQARGKKPANCFSAQNTHGADFNKNGIVGPAKAGVHDGDLLDLGIWRNTYIKENTQGTNPPNSDNPTTGGATGN